jgi:SH3 domain-containing protein
MLKLIFLISFCLWLTTANAEEYYCWAISGLNIRETPSPDGVIKGKLLYGEKVDIDMMNQEYSNYYEDLFLTGINEDNSADIKFKGSWLKIELNGIHGYVFSGYLSRFPNFQVEKTDNEIRCETFKKYMSRNYKLLNYNIAVWDSVLFDNKVRSFSWEKGITVINGNNEKGMGSNLIFAEMTPNEALLFVKFYFQLLDINNPDDKSKLEASIHFYGLSVTNDRYEINFPAPDGKITILIFWPSIVITYYGSC